MRPENDFDYDKHDDHVVIRIRRDERDLPDVLRRALIRAASAWWREDLKEHGSNWPEREDSSFVRKIAAAILHGADDEPRLAPDELFAEEVDS